MGGVACGIVGDLVHVEEEEDAQAMAEFPKEIWAQQEDNLNDVFRLVYGLGHIGHRGHGRGCEISIARVRDVADDGG